MSKVVLVTGTSRGIGLAVAQRLLREGHVVIALSRSAADTRHTGVEGSSPQLHRVCADVRDYDEVEAAVRDVVEQTGRLDAAVMNAGISAPRGWGASTPSDWAAVLDTNLLGAANTVISVLPHIRKSPHGGLIFVGSYVGERISPASAYSVSKAGISALAESTWRDLRESGDERVSVTLLEPGWTETEMLSRPRAGALTPAEVAGAISFVLDRPPGVEVRRLTIKPTRQADY